MADKRADGVTTRQYAKRIAMCTMNAAAFSRKRVSATRRWESADDGDDDDDDDDDDDGDASNS